MPIARHPSCSPMIRFTQTFGLFCLTALSLSSFSIILDSNRAIAQLGGDSIGTPEEELTPICTPSIADGIAKCNYPGGDNYQGELRSGLPHGRGVYVYATGDRYQGMFLNGKPNGQGLLIKVDDSRLEGVFENGVLTTGRAVFPDGKYYEGTFDLVTNVSTNVTSSQPDGRGRFVYPDNSRYEGEFFAGQPFGKGALLRPDGTRCQGQFFNENLDANVQCVFPDGSRYEGEVRGGIPHGKGTLISPSGQRTSGRFREGKFAN
ncbi:MORN repeat-containing protein [Roseofilum casamattae]|uniref:MORN motif-containing protein n=1 Tax=Roseofilum casamattae BLCC-M143 TaxID=3022442 RepID=A0ABT7BY49_9CYAN|nr:hypothetical protein [Roseofilum casamattae]MDJ1184127.1 MORN motif-containing protein [Roseofilum casamattae BLCC-M143]